MGLLQETIQSVLPHDKESRKKARDRLDQLSMPHWALGRLMDLAVDLAGMTGSIRPKVARKTMVTMAGDHGVVAEGVSQYPQEVTLQMIHNFVNGGAGINALARQSKANVVVVDMGVSGDLSTLIQEEKIKGCSQGKGTANLALGPAMTQAQAVGSIESGIRLANELGRQSDLFGTGEMGIGNTTASSAIAAVVCNKAPRYVTGHGTGIDTQKHQHKIEIITKALEINRPDPQDGIDVLRKVGGFEIGGIAGLILASAVQRKPILIDGFISTAGALIAKLLCPTSMDYVIAAHRSVEPGHAYMLEFLDKNPLLDLGMRLGEGTGAALAMNLVEAAVAVLCEVATFEEASVSKAVE